MALILVMPIRAVSYVDQIKELPFIGFDHVVVNLVIDVAETVVISLTA